MPVIARDTGQTSCKCPLSVAPSASITAATNLLRHALRRLSCRRGFRLVRAQLTSYCPCLNVAPSAHLQACTLCIGLCEYFPKFLANVHV
eukprot:3300502-Pleurochrysis_carterae.AAC.1